jgi:hypothetical protein
LVSPEQVVAAGSAGTTFTVGYIRYLVVLVLSSGLNALIYHCLKVVMCHPYTGGLRYLIRGHSVLGNIVLGAALRLLMYDGYFGKAAHVHPTMNYTGEVAQCVHDQILGSRVPVISSLLIVGSLEPLFGGYRLRGPVPQREIRPSAKPMPFPKV